MTKYIEILKNRVSGLKREERGSALLVALLIMGVLIAVSMALSALILRELYITRGFLDSGRAYYAAESGVEISLYNLENRLPGWEPEGGVKLFYADEDKNAVGEVEVRNRCSSYPCFDPDRYDISSAAHSPEVFYGVLELNESIDIPLFIVENGEEVPVSDFSVQFFTLFNPAEVLRVEAADEVMKNVLRWKVFGIPEDSEENLRTEAISGYAPLSNITYIMDDVEESFRTRATNPSWFGTVDCSSHEEAGERLGEMGIDCIPYHYDALDKFDWEEIEDYEDLTPDQFASLYFGECRFNEAKEFYKYDREGHVEQIYDCYPINEFLRSHRLNYLSMTNLINPDLFVREVPGALTDEQVERFSKIYFRVELFGDEEGRGGETVREVADITSEGYSGNSRKSVNVKVRRGSFMPVFYFTVYSTYGAE